MNTKLNDRIWTAPADDDTLGPEGRKLFEEIKTEFLQEQSRRDGDGTAADPMLAERVAFLYALIRDKESRNGAGLILRSKEHQDAVKLWFTMVVKLRDMWAPAVGESEVRDSVLARVNQAVQEAISQLDDKETQSRVRKVLTAAFEEANL